LLKVIKLYFKISQKIGSGMANLTQRDMAGILKVDAKTIYNWRKNKPELYRIVVLGFKFDEFLTQSRENLIELEKLAEENKTLRLK